MARAADVAGDHTGGALAGRAAELARLLDAGRGDAAVALASELAPSWAALGYGARERALLERTVALAGADPGPDRHLLGELVLAAESLALQWMGADPRASPASARERIQQGLHLIRGADRARRVRSLALAAEALLAHGDDEFAGVVVHEGMLLTRGERSGSSRAAFLAYAAVLGHRQGDPARAAAGLALAHDVAAGVQDPVWIVRTALLMDRISPRYLPVPLGRQDPAELLALARTAGDRYLEASVLVLGAGRRGAQGDPAGAARWCGGALRIARDPQATPPLTGALMVLVGLLAGSGAPRPAARLHGSVLTLLPRVRFVRPAEHDAVYHQVAAGLRARLDEAVYAREIELGGLMPLASTLDTALEHTDALAAEQPPSHPDASGRPAELTARQVEVLRLLATGASNRDIGAALGVTSKTVMHHCTHIFRKVGVDTRASAVAWAYEHGLIQRSAT